MMIVPSILTDSLETVEQQIELSLSVGLSRVQVDVIDPEFADNTTIHPIDLLDIPLHEVAIDFHLMTNDPINDVVECSQVPGIKTIIAQIERMGSQTAFLEHVQSYSIGTGFSLDAYTEVDELDDSVLQDCAIIQLMGNKAGKQGQSFLGEHILEKVKYFADLRVKKDLSYLIAVDIGMTPEHALECAQAGADMITPGSYLWTAPNVATAIEAYTKNL